MGVREKHGETTTFSLTPSNLLSSSTPSKPQNPKPRTKKQTVCSRRHRHRHRHSHTTMKRLYPITLSRALSRALSSSSSTSSSAQSTAFPLKHVTKGNFESALAELRRHVAAADFVAIDLEMSGVTSAPWRESFEFDRSDVRYLKVKDSAEKFAVVQFGVCPFRWDSSKLSFIAHPYVTLAFPHIFLFSMLCLVAQNCFVIIILLNFVKRNVGKISNRKEGDL